MWPGFPAPTAPPAQTPKPKTIGTPIYPPSGQMPPIIHVTPINIPPTITITSDPAPQSMKSIFHEFAGIKEPDRCTCDIMKLMAVGCKCGQFQREQSKK